MMPPQTRTRRRRRRWISWSLLLSLAVVLLAFSATPWLLSSEPVRDRVLNAFVPSPHLRLSSRSASFGWLSPLQVQGLQIESPQDHLLIDVERLAAERSWWQLWMAEEQLGHFELVEPDIRLDLNWREFDGYEAPRIPPLSASVRGADLMVDIRSLREPVIDVDDLDLDFQVEAGDQGRVISFDRGPLVKRRKLTPEMCSELLQLMDPLLDEVVRVEGEASLYMERFDIPLEVKSPKSEQIDFAGPLHLHEVSAGIKTPLLKSIVRVAAQMHGREPSDVVQVVNDSVVEIEVREGRIHHSGLTFGLPGISSKLRGYSKGSVGLDQSLELTVLIPKLLLEPGGEPDLEKLVELQIAGTLKEPEVSRTDRRMDEIDELPEKLVAHYSDLSPVPDAAAGATSQ